jgi:predicted solute-binding protein
MLRNGEAALLIGDPALRLHLMRLPYCIYDLGEEWMEMTGLPMVFAVWAGRGEAATPETGAALLDSCRYGRQRLEEIVAREAPRRGFPPEFAREYLTRNIVHELEPRDYQGMELFLRYARGVAPANLAAASARRSRQ